jgi:hemolysin III
MHYKYMSVNRVEPQRRQLTVIEEVVNSITHGFGIMFSIAALVILVIVASIHGDIWHIVSFSIFGASMIFLYTASTLYHGFTNARVKDIFARLDHVAIFMLIAGTYTPFLLTTIRGTLGWTFFGIIWGIAVSGMVIRSIYLHRYRRLMVSIYLLMGWMFVFMLNSMIRNLPDLSLIFLLIGGLSYTVGVIFYAWRKLPFGHGIWHLFVLGGSVMHFFAVLYILA